MMALMKQLGIKSEEISASRVVIEKKDGKKIVVEEAQVIQIDMQGKKSFQVMGAAKEESANEESSSEKESAENDVEIIVAQTGASKEEASKALEKTRGDLAEAILLLKK